MGAGIDWKNRAWPGTSWEEQRAFITGLRRRGIRVLLVVGYASVYDDPEIETDNLPGRNGSNPAWSSYLSEHFYPTVEELAAFVAGEVDAWEVWNEPDFPAPAITGQTGYDVGMPAGIYSSLLANTASRIREHSSAPIVVGGLASGDLGWLERVNLEPADAIGLHPYLHSVPGVPMPGAVGTLGEGIDRVLSFGLPIWITEIGHGSDTVNTGNFVRGVFETAASYAEAVPHVFWYSYSDRMKSGFGLTDFDFELKDSGAAFRSGASPWNAACEVPLDSVSLPGEPSLTD